MLTLVRRRAIKTKPAKIKTLGKKINILKYIKIKTKNTNH